MCFKVALEGLYSLKAYLWGKRNTEVANAIGSCVRVDYVGYKAPIFGTVKSRKHVVKCFYGTHVIQNPTIQMQELFYIA